MTVPNVDWNDLRLFVLTARLGGLAAAARAAGVSPPTLGRRLQALETALGRSLFDRLPSGYALTDAGHDLLAHAEPVEAAMLAVERWRDRRTVERTVRISAGTWTSRFLARHVAALIGPDDRFGLALLTAEERLDIGRRAAEIGLRARRPEEAWLAGQRIGQVAYAVYAPAASPTPDGFIAPTETITASSRWLRAEHATEIRIEASSPRAVLDMVRAGAGRAILPCFVGDAEPALVRLGAPIPALSVEQWLVMHHEERHDPAVRLVAGRLARLLRAHRPAFAASVPEEPRRDP
jgi:DNA-binding transcriptional LysR family regulator